MEEKMDINAERGFFLVKNTMPTTMALIITIVRITAAAIDPPALLLLPDLDLDGDPEPEPEPESPESGVDGAPSVLDEVPSKSGLFLTATNSSGP